MIYGFPDETGRLWAVHNDSAVAELPDGAVEITDEQFNNRFDYVVEGGEVVYSPLYPSTAPFVPDRVTMRQARLALLGAGLLDDVEAALAALEGAAGQAARIEWEYSQEVWRNKPFVQQVAGAISMSDEQLDQLFIIAAGIE